MRAREARTTRCFAMAAVVMVMGLATACGASSDGSGVADKSQGNGASQPSTASASDASSDPAPGTTAGGGGKAGKTLSKQELDKAVLTERDVQGYTVTTMPGAPPGGEEADRAECQPLTAMINAKPEPAAVATVYRQIVGGRSAGCHGVPHRAQADGCTEGAR